MLIYCVVVTVIAVCVMLPINLTGEGEVNTCLLFDCNILIATRSVSLCRSICCILLFTKTPGEFGFAHSTGTNIVPRSWRLWVYAAVATFVSAMAYMCIVWYQHEFFEVGAIFFLHASCSYANLRLPDEEKVCSEGLNQAMRRIFAHLHTLLSPTLQLGSEGVNRHTVKLRNISKDYSEDDVSKVVLVALLNASF